MKAAIRLFLFSELLDSNVAASAQQEYDVNPEMPGNHHLDDDAVRQAARDSRRKRTDRRLNDSGSSARNDFGCKL